MARKKKNFKSTGRRRPGWWSLLDMAARGRLVRWGGGAILCAVILIAADVALGRLESHVERSILAERVSSSIRFVDLPVELGDLAFDDLMASVADVERQPWTGQGQCRALADRLAAVGWVARVNYVRRRSDAVFDVSCRFRRPAALVQQDGSFFLVDAQAVRLPGRYLYDSNWQIIQGVLAAPPEPGEVWAGKDVQAGLSLLAVLATEPYRDQLTGVLVGNYAGRRDAHAAHLELATDRSGGRIRWGSPPGMEVEENTVQEKLRLLRKNDRNTGRADAGHVIIDIATFPDRFTIPG
ncbi:MAG: hypothetical protein IIB57_08115 [Planctomycetes bacterium]|nr:hypothetical protein [Planctomycetota bacterium]